MILKDTQIQGAFLIEHASYPDERGLFYEIIDKDLLNQFDNLQLNKVNISKSKSGVLRGLHYQIVEPQNKFVSCIKGKVIDFAIDIRKKSDTFGKFIQIELNENKSETLFLPAGVAHGFLSLSDSILLYLVSGTYLKKFERGINYKSIDLHLPEEPRIINERDINWPDFKEAEYYEEDL